MEMSVEKQIYYLKKIMNKEITSEELCDYITMIIRDNVPGSIEITFNKDASNVGGSYSPNIRAININSLYIEDIAKGNNNIVELLNTIGHELRHYNQYNYSFKSHINEFNMQYYNKLKASLNKKASLDVPSREFYHQANLIKAGNYLHELQLDEFPHLKEWLEKHEFNREDINYSYYLQMAYEEDARYGGIVYSKILLNQYKEYLKKFPDKKLSSYIEFLNDYFQVHIDNFERDKELYNSYLEFEKVFEDVSYDAMEKVFQLQNSDELNRVFYKSLLDMFAQKYVDNSSVEELEIMMFSNIHFYSLSFGKTATTDLIERRRDYHALIIEKIISSKLSDEKKKELGDALMCGLLKNIDKRSFTMRDSFISELYVHNILSEKQIDKLATKLYKKGRYMEASNILAFDKASTKYTYSEGEIHNIYKCIDARLNLLQLVSDKVISKKSIDHKFVSAYITHLNSLEICIEEYISQVKCNFSRDTEFIERRETMAEIEMAKINELREMAKKKLEEVEIKIKPDKCKNR